MDVDERKLVGARELGATHTVDARAEDPVEAIRALTGGFGADVVIDAVGRPETYRQAFYARDLAGTVVLVGVPTPEHAAGAAAAGRLRPRRGAHLVLVRRLPARAGLPDAGRSVPPGSPAVGTFVSETIPLDGVEAAFGAMQRGDVLRSVVVF